MRSKGMSAFLNYFSVFGRKEELKHNDFFIHAMQKRFPDLWQFVTESCDRVVCCPLGSSLDEEIRRDDMERHVLMPLSGAGEFVSLRGDKVDFSG